MPNFSPVKGLSSDEIEVLIDKILTEATLEEKVAMMSGRGFFEAMREDKMVWGARPYRAGGGIERLGVPAFYFTDGPRGVARGQSTCFPCTMARGASWDVDLERRIGEVMGIETRAQGCNLNGAVCINLLRHPGWGRAQETYGEDPFHMGEMGAGLATGIQTHNVAATVKHFALNSIENSRFKVDVQIDERDLREIYLPHFKRVLDAGCATVMSAYNKFNGEYCGQHRELLTDILRHEWGFDGFVHSDWIMGVYEPYGAVAGLDVENPEPVHFGQKLIDAVSNGQIAPDVVETACRRILRVLYRFACAQDPLADYDTGLVASAGHIALAREAAEKSAVLLKNDGVLPLAKTQKIGVFGVLAELENTGDHGSSKVNTLYVKTPMQGLSEYLGLADAKLAGDERDVAGAAKAAKALDVAIVVVGTTALDEGEYIPGEMGGAMPVPKELQALADEKQAETPDNAGALGSGFARGGDRENLRLSGPQVEMIKAISAVNKNTVIVIVSGSAIVCSEWVGAPGAVLQTFYSGMEGGAALARLLFGDVSPSGKLPFTVALDEEDYPFFDKDADEMTYDGLHGYTLLERSQKKAQFCFGHGLSYAAFTYRALKCRKRDGGLQVQVSVTNTGDCAATEIAQLYVSFPNKSVERPLKLLRGFERIDLEPGETGSVFFTVPEADLCYWNAARRDWQMEAGAHTVFVGGSSMGDDLLQVEVSL